METESRLRKLKEEFQQIPSQIKKTPERIKETNNFTTTMLTGLLGALGLKISEEARINWQVLPELVMLLTLSGVWLLSANNQIEYENLEREYKRPKKKNLLYKSKSS